MGANAVTTVPVYVAGEVLTAADLNITNSGIPVFASTVERDAAFGGTGEKTLAEGQFAYLEDTNTTQYYDGAAWQSVGVTPGLVFITSQTIGSAVSSVTVSNAFSSTYDNYKILISGGVGSTNLELNMTLGATATGYYRFVVYGAYNASTVSGFNQSNGTSWGGVGKASTGSIDANIEVRNPNATKNTHFNSVFTSSSTTGDVHTNGGYLNDTTAYTAFTLTCSTGNITGGTIRVYGYRNS
jgi:hypothetical protein